MCTSLPGFFVWVLRVDLEVPSLAWCISYFSIAVVKHHGHDSLSKKELIWALGSRNFKSIHNVGQHEQGQKAENSHLGPEAWSRESEPEVAGDFLMSKSAAGEALSPARLHYLNLPKCCHQLGTKCSNAQLLGTLLIQTITHHTQTLYCQSYLSNPQILVIFLKKR